jgi:predicted RNase H-like nuclease (RuvC/YqgF family)
MIGNFIGNQKEIHYHTPIQAPTIQDISEPYKKTISLLEEKIETQKQIIEQLKIEVEEKNKIIEQLKQQIRERKK